MPTKFTDGKRTITLELREHDPQTGQDRPDWSNDFYDTGILEQNEDGAFIVDNLNYLVDQALDWKYGIGDFLEDEPVKPGFRHVYINGRYQIRCPRRGIYEHEKTHAISLLRSIQKTVDSLITAFSKISDKADPQLISNLITEIRRANDAITSANNLRWRNEL